MKWSIRMLILLEVFAGLSLIFDEVREITFPDGTTAPEALIVLLILRVLEELLKIRQFFQEV